MLDDSYIPASQRWNRVLIHQNFLEGQRNTAQWSDYANLTDSELDALQSFIHFILKRRDLEGSNKPSFTAGTLTAIDGESAAFYNKTAAWHYHSGPGYNGHFMDITEWWLPANAHGRQSAEVVHYSKKQIDQPPGKYAITILAFSRVHVPFPDATDYRNPLTERLRTLINSIDA